ncbi:MAG: peptide ABC transporter substrate-binding protein [Spirulinaceae cyanobacterium SM2_1_0]|nr:peptide ABC transporter substrate-binding protein [Spirulinaceae cyanobacterium SM2_1_0]
MKRAIAPTLLCGSLLLSGVLAACNPQPASETTESSPAASADDTLRLLYWQAPTILNPHLSTGFKDAEASRITLEPLASFDAEGEMQLFLAAEIPTLENGGLAEDGRSVTWKLKEGVTWSDGEPFTAEDVVFTHEFISDPATGATSAGTYEAIASVEALDDHTVRVNFTDVTPAWFLVFVGTEGMILPEHAFADYVGEAAREAPANLMPIGTGPYRVTEFKPGDVVLYEANPEYREADDLGFQTLELKGGGDAASAARAVLQTGDADFAYNLQVEASVLDELVAAGEGELATNFGSLMERIVINHSDPAQDSRLDAPHPFLSEEPVRQAIALAIDREAIASQLYGATGQPTASFVVAPPQFVTEGDYAQDLEQAAELLDAAGWVDSNGDGRRDRDGVEMQLVFQTSVNPLRQKTQEIIKQNLAELGLVVELKSIDPSVYFSGDPANTDTVERFRADLQMYTTGNTSPDPGAYLQNYTCDQIPTEANGWTGDNPSRYCNPDYDERWQQSLRELDPDQRREQLAELSQILITGAHVIPLVHRAETAGVSQSLQGVNLTPWDLNVWNIAQWRRE